MKKILTVLFLFIGLYSSAQVRAPKAWWNFDETSGTTLSDAVGSNSLTVAGTLAINSSTALSGKSIFFDDDYDRATLTTAITQTTGSYMFLVRISNISADMVMAGNDGAYSRIFIGAGNNFKYETNTNGQEFADYNTYSTNTWYQLVAVRNVDTVKFYRNGSFLSKATITSSASLTISAIGWVGKSFRGYMDMAAVWDVALSSAEVSALYNSGAPLVYPFVAAPTVTTQAVSAIVGTTATGNGNVTSDGGATVTARGVCWSVSTTPTTANDHTTESGTTGAFTSSITGLSTSQSYYVRAYATNSVGTSYGSQVTFTSGTGALTLPPGAISNNIKFTSYSQLGNTVSKKRYVHRLTGTVLYPGYYTYPLRKASSGTYLEDQNGKPFFFSGDAAWSMSAQPTTPQIKQYLDNRKNKGFTAILTNIGEHYFSSYAPNNNVYGKPLFTGTAFRSSANTAFFAHVDTMINEANKRNMIVMLLPLYFGYAGGDEGWDTEINAATDAEMKTYGQFLGNRYKDFTNIMWVIGGDRIPTSPINFTSKINSFLEGLKQYDNHLITGHGPHESYALPTFGGAAWMDVDNVYTRDKTSYTWFGSSNTYGQIISHWSMDETSGTTMVDGVGGVTMTKINTLTPSSGKIAGSQRFAFSSLETATSGATSKYNFAGSSSFSITYWMKFTETQYGLNGGQDHIIISKGEWGGGGATQDGMIASGVNGAGKVNFLLRDNTGYKVDLEGTPTYNDGVWHLVCLVRDGSLKKSILYCDNVIIDSLTHNYTGSFATTLPLRFASLLNGGVPQYYYSGYLDDVNIFSKALSKAEITKLYTQSTLQATLPIFFIEGAYENDPTYPLTDAEQRNTMYSTFLSGGCGYVFGNVPLFAFGYNAYGLGTNWVGAMDDVCSNSMNYMQKLFIARPWHLLQPDLTHLTLTNGYGIYGNTNYVTSALSSDQNCFIAYVPNSSTTVTVNLSRIKGDSVNCWWYNPSNAQISLINKFLSSGSQSFTSPVGDQVLVIDNTAANYPLPGTRVYPYPNPPSVGDTIKYYWAEDFESATTADVNSVAGMEGFFGEYRGDIHYSNMSIATVGGSKMLQADISSYYEAPTDCFSAIAITFPLGDTTSDAWCDGDILVPSDFDPFGIGNDGSVSPSHKISIGMEGSNYGGLSFTDSLTLSGFGSWTHIVNTGDRYTGGASRGFPYIYSHGVWDYAHHTDHQWYSGYAVGDSGYVTMDTGKKLHFTLHYKISRPGYHDGYLEIFCRQDPSDPNSKNRLIARTTGIESRSAAQGANFGKMEEGVMSFFLGGESSTMLHGLPLYGSRRRNTAYFDNLVWYTYKPGAVNYRRKVYKGGTNTGGVFSNGPIAPIITPPVSSLRPALLLTDEAYTTPDTIYDVGNGKFYIYQPPSMSGYITKTVTAPVGKTLQYRFLTAEFGFPPDSPDQDAWVKAYTGIGINKTGMIQYGRTSRSPYPAYTAPGTGWHSIASRYATFEIHEGTRGGETRGFAIEVRAVP